MILTHTADRMLVLDTLPTTHTERTPESTAYMSSSHDQEQSCPVTSVITSTNDGAWPSTTPEYLVSSSQVMNVTVTDVTYTEGDKSGLTVGAIAGKLIKSISLVVISLS